MIRCRFLTNLCYLAMMCLAIGLNLLPVFLTSLGVEMGGLSNEALGKLGAISFSGLVIGIMITGPLADKWGAKPFAMLGCSLLTLSLPLSAYAPDYVWLCVSLFCLGLGAGILDMILSPVVSALNPERRTTAMNWLHSFYCCGAVVTILLGMLVLQMGYGWRTACLVMIPLPLILVIAFARQQFPEMGGGEGSVKVGTLIRKKWFAYALIAIFLGGATELGMAQWLPAYAETALEFPLWVSGASLLLFSLAMAAGRMIIGMMPKLNPFLLMAIGCGLSVVFFLLGAFLPIPTFALAACIIAGFTGSCLWPTTLAVTADKYPDGNASMFGLLAALGNAGGIFMPWLVGWVADRHDLHWGLAISALAPALMLPLVLRMKVRA